MKRLFPLFFGICLLILLRISNLSIRLSDSNIYFYTAYELLQGKMLYKDIFFTNLPLFPYISALYLFFSANNIYFYYLTPTIEISCITFLLYIIVLKQYKNYSYALCSSYLYIFSFMVLSTSVHQTGVFLASLFAILAYYFLIKKRFFITGIFLALMLLTKAYFIPVVLAFFTIDVINKSLISLKEKLLGFLITVFCILLPFILFSKDQLFHDIISYSLTRGAGVSKIDIFWFFIFKDFLFFILTIFSLYNYKKNPFVALVSFFSILFFIFYSDPYYLYLNFLPPFLCLSLPDLFESLNNHFRVQKMVYPTLLGIFLLYTFFTYLSGFQNLGTYTNISDVIKTIEKDNPNVLYGVNDATPAFAFLTQKPLLNNIIDTNPNIFRKKLLHATELTKTAIKQKALVIVHGAYYPEYNINQPIMDEIVDSHLLSTQCKIILSHPIYTEGITNRLTLFSCR